MAAAMFMNSNSLPIALMQSLVISVPGLKWGDDDSKNAMVGRALTYLVVYSTLGMIVGFPLVVDMLILITLYINSYAGVMVSGCSLRLMSPNLFPKSTKKPLCLVR